MVIEDFSFPKLWVQVRSKSWLWLFRRHQIEEGGRLLKHGEIGLAGVHVCAENEVELIAGVGTGLFNSASVTAHLRLREDGSMTMTSHCTCAVGTLCQHAAALMLMLDHEDGHKRIQFMAKLRDKTSIAADDESATPAESAEVELPPSEPKPLLLVRRMRVEMPLITAKKNIGGWEPRSVAFIQPCAEYDDCPLRFEMLVRSPAHQWQDENEVRHTLVRNQRFERLLLTDLSALGFKSFSEALPGAKAPESTLGFMAMAGDQALVWSQFLKDQVPKLRESGWRVEVPEGIGFQIHEANEDAWFTDLAGDQDGREWFSLDLGVEIEGRRISMVPLLVDCIDQGLNAAVLEKNLDQRFLL
jgi:hypothetical protein